MRNFPPDPGNYAIIRKISRFAGTSLLALRTNVANSITLSDIPLHFGVVGFNDQVSLTGSKCNLALPSFLSKMFLDTNYVCHDVPLLQHSSYHDIAVYSIVCDVISA